MGEAGGGKAGPVGEETACCNHAPSALRCPDACGTAAMGCSPRTLPSRAPESFRLLRLPPAYVAQALTPPARMPLSCLQILLRVHHQGLLGSAGRLTRDLFFRAVLGSHQS